MKENNNDLQEADDSLITQDNKPYSLQSPCKITNLFNQK